MTAADIAVRTGLSQVSSERRGEQEGKREGMAHSTGRTSREPYSGSIAVGGHDDDRRTIIVGGIAIAVGAGGNGSGSRSHGNGGGSTGAAMQAQAMGFSGGAGGRGNRGDRSYG